MVDIGSLDEIKSINIKDFTKITKFTCSGEELELLLILIENNNLPEISAQFKNNKDKLLSLILNLHYLNLIDFKLKDIVSKPPLIDLGLLIQFILISFLEAVGPIANFILDDTINEMGETKENFTLKRIPELINILSREIPRKDKKIKFQKAMIEKLKEIKMV
ncbi:MAG: hypothetical protein RBR53_07725 [Desulforegulaceae bacterium]|nr:hypothetical protein [Desulforegulaceae bacterium]